MHREPCTNCTPLNRPMQASHRVAHIAARCTHAPFTLLAVCAWPAPTHHTGDKFDERVAAPAGAACTACHLHAQRRVAEAARAAPL